MDIRSLWQGLQRKIAKPKQPLELTVVDQRVILALHMAHQVSAHELQRIINLDWPADRVEVAMALRKLELVGYVEKLPAAEGGEARYQATKASQRLRYLIPQNPRSNMDLWI